MSFLSAPSKASRVALLDGGIVNRIEERFQYNVDTGRSAFMPFFTAGFPDLATTEELIRRADTTGATAIEIGFPYSDSVADGPIIQESFNHVLERGGGSVRDIFAMLARVRGDVNCAIVAMVSYSLVHRYGNDRFMSEAVAAGVDGVIIPDLPVEELKEAGTAISSAGLCHIGLVAPTTTPSRRAAIANASSGFLYMIAVSGITGERQELSATLRTDVSKLREASGLPVCVGFGISTTEHVRSVSAFADGAIVGSAIVRRIAECVEESVDQSTLVDTVGAFLSDLMSGTDPAKA
jgi:tryptophan synthase alpha chain